MFTNTDAAPAAVSQHTSPSCLIYARVSTEEQAELSIPAQVQAMREYARRQNWTVTEEFLEPGVSGRSIERRTALQAMLQRCRETPKVHVVLVHKIDRLARSVFDHATIRFLLQQQSIKLASVVENVDDSVSGQLLENIMASIAQFYSANLGEEVKKGMRMKVERGGWPHKPPRGYRIVKRDGGGCDIEIDEIEGTIIKKMFERYATGMYSVRDLVNYLTESGIRSRAGSAVSLQYVLNLLKNGFYAGRVRWHGAERAGNHPALISEALLVKVRQTIRWRHRNYYERGKLKFMMRGVARCAECGARMTAERHGRFSYYRCVRNTIHRGACPARYSNVAVSHQAVARLYKALHVREGLRTAIRQHAQAHFADRQSIKRSAEASLKQREAALRAKEVRLADSFADGAMSAEAYRQVAAKIQQERLAIATASNEMTMEPDAAMQKLDAVLRVAESLYDLHTTLPEPERATLLRIVFREIVLDRGTIVSYRLNTPFDELVAVDGQSGSPPRLSSELKLTEARSTTISILEFTESGRLPDSILRRSQDAA